MSNKVIDADATKLKNKPAVKGTTCKGTGLIIHRPYLLNFIIRNIKSLTPVSNLLIV